MEDLKPVIAKNIADLRVAHGFTQLELAEKLNYSDKAVSKWERGESLPDVTVLKQISDLFGVTLDYLVNKEHAPEEIKTAGRFSHGFITAAAILAVWLVATLVFVLLELILPEISSHWLAFIWAVPLSFVVWLVLNSIWFNKRLNYTLISFLMWSLLTAIYLSFFVNGFNYWLIFVIGAPAQVVIVVWSGISKRHR